LNCCHFAFCSGVRTAAIFASSAPRSCFICARCASITGSSESTLAVSPAFFASKNSFIVAWACSKHALFSSRDALPMSLICTFWTLLAVLSSANWLLDPRGPGFRPIDPSGPVIVAFIESWTWAALTPLIFRLSSRFSLTRAPLLIVIGVVISIGVFLLLGFARQVVFAPLHHRPYRGLIEVGRLRFVPQLLFYFAILAAGFAREYFLRDQERQAHATLLQ